MNPPRIMLIPIINGFIPPSGTSNVVIDLDKVDLDDPDSVMTFLAAIEAMKNTAAAIASKADIPNDQPGKVVEGKEKSWTNRKTKKGSTRKRKTSRGITSCG